MCYLLGVKVANEMFYYSWLALKRFEMIISIWDEMITSICHEMIISIWHGYQSLPSFVCRCHLPIEVISRDDHLMQDGVDHLNIL